MVLRAGERKAGVTDPELGNSINVPTIAPFLKTDLTRHVGALISGGHCV